jgi:adenylate cyclase
MSEQFERKLTAILSADAVGYSRLMRDDESATVRTITAYMKAMTDLVVHHRGRVVDTPGDNILADFASVVDAVQCALEIQTVLGDRNAELPESRRMAFRIGINLGDVIIEGDRLYGDGVNIAARLEGLAEPGGICISGTVYEHIRNKLTLWDEYLGEHSVKNIAEAVKVYRLLLKPPSSGTADGPSTPDARTPDAPRPARRRWPTRAALGALLVLLVGYTGWRLMGPEPGAAPRSETTTGSPVLPSVAVLAFDNMSDDPAQEYFSDGISEDLITDLAKISGLLVTARNTTFAYKGQAVNVVDVGRELGVAYVVEGSVRKAAGRLRINAQLLDAQTGAHVWADRYDGATEDVFALQDEVVSQIVAALRITLTVDEEQSIANQGTEDLAAYELVKRGWWHYHHFNRENNGLARDLFNRAIEADSGYAEAVAGLGFTYYEEWAQFWTQDPGNLGTVRALALASLELDPSRPGTHTLLSHAYLWTGQHDLAIAEMETALALDPDDQWIQRDFAEVLIFSGRADEAVRYARRAMELNPRYVASFPFTLAFAYLALGRHDEAIRVLDAALELNPNYMPIPLLLVASHMSLGNESEARRYAAQALALNPQLTVDALTTRMPFRDASLWEERAALLRQAGIP